MVRDRDARESLGRGKMSQSTFSALFLAVELVYSKQCCRWKRFRIFSLCYSRPLRFSQTIE